MNDWGIPTVAAIVVICYAIGVILKNSEKFKDNYIPIAMIIVGAVLGEVAFFCAPDLIQASDAISALAIGFMSGMTATGINQVYKQIKKKEE